MHVSRKSSPRGIRNSQNIAYGIILGLVTAMAIFAYHHIHREWVVFRKAEASFRGKNFSEAIPLYREAIEEGIRSATALHHLGESLLEAGMFQEALENYERLTRLYPEDVHAVKTLAALYDQFQRVDEAIALYTRLESRLELDTQSLLRMADLYKRKHAFEAAQTAYGKVLARSPRSPSARRGLAELQGWMQHYGEAIALYRSVLEDRPDDRTARIGLARVLGWSGRLEEAIEEYRIALGTAHREESRTAQ